MGSINRSWRIQNSHIHIKRHYILKRLLWALESVLLDIPAPSYDVLPFPRDTQSAVRMPRTEGSFLAVDGVRSDDRWFPGGWT